MPYSRVANTEWPSYRFTVVLHVSNKYSYLLTYLLTYLNVEKYVTVSKRTTTLITANNGRVKLRHELGVISLALR